MKIGNLGCMQNGKADGGSEKDYDDAAAECDSSFGGRLPTVSEWVIALKNYSAVVRGG